MCEIRDESEVRDLNNSFLFFNFTIFTNIRAVTLYTVNFDLSPLTRVCNVGYILFFYSLFFIILNGAL